MEAKEKFAHFKKKAFARFKSHSCDVPLSAELLTAYSTKTTVNNNYNTPMVHDKIINNGPQENLNFFENKLVSRPPG